MTSTFTISISSSRVSLLPMSSVRLSSGDRVIMISDGASYLPFEFFKKALHDKKDADEKELARYILEKAVESTPGGRCDDITVCAVTLR